MVSKVYVVGVGMGNPQTLTREAADALAASDLIIGSRRLIDALDAYGAQKVCLILSAEISEALHTTDTSVASVVLSGDVGLYSGATALYDLIGDLNVEVIPGISSLAYLCARLRVPWQDVHVVSAHGRACNVVGAVRTHAKTFVLTGGATTPASVCAELVEGGLAQVQVAVGENLSYEDERLVQGTAAELISQEFGPLCAVLVTNDTPLADAVYGPRLADGDFVRGKVPMTKEEVRTLAIAKLRIRCDDTVWDVGAGTGSVSVEAARAAREGTVWAVERKAEAVGLIEANASRHGATNLRVVCGQAPEALSSLPAPDRVFVGGSSGKLDSIVCVALDKNPQVRLCIAAVTLQTLTAALACLEELQLANVDIVHVGIAKARELGPYHMMQAANPVYLISCEGPGALCSKERDYG